MIFNQALIENPKFLFILDSLGALLSAFMLGVVLVHFKSFFGIPITTLYILATLPLLFVAFDVYSYFSADSQLGINLRRIAIINLSYCLLSLSLAFYHIELITVYGWIYIVIEIIIVLFIANLEFKTGNKYLYSNTH